MSNDYLFPPLNPDDVPIVINGKQVNEHTKIIDRTAADNVNQAPNDGITSAPKKQFYDRVPEGVGAAKKNVFKVLSPHSGAEGNPTTQGDIQQASETRSITTSTGSSITLSGGAHNEAIEILHHSGVNITINPDGSIGIVAGPSLGLGSTSGDVNLAAAKSVTITGADVTVSSRGQLTLKSETSGITMEAKGGILIQSNEGSIQAKAENRMILNSGTDTSITAGGAFAVTSGATASIQTDNQFSVDAGWGSKITAKDGNVLHGNHFEIKGKGPSDISSMETITVASGNDLNLESVNSTHVKANKTATLEGKDASEVKSKIINLQAKDGDINLDATSTIQTRSDTTNIFATTLGVTTGTTEMTATGTFKSYASGNMDLRGAPLDLNVSTPTSQPVPSPETTSPEAATAPTEPDAPKTFDTEAITQADGSTSKPVAPEFDGNAHAENQSTMSTNEGEGTSVPSKAKQISDQTPDPAVAAGELDPEAVDQGVTDNADTAPSGSDSTSEETNIREIEPASMGAEAADFLGNYAFPGFEKIPESGQVGKSSEQIKHNIITWLHNVLALVMDNFPEENVRVAPRGFVIAPAGASAEQSGHFTGLAGDISIANQNDYAKVASIALWIQRNIHVDDVIIEKDKAGRAHIHVLIPETTPGGSNAKGRRTIFTCNDPKCSAPEEGVQMKYLTGTVETTDETTDSGQ